jgi:hypothetical protein
MISGYSLIRALRYFKDFFPDRVKLITALWLLLPAGYMAVHLNELSKTYAVFKTTNSLVYFSSLRESLDPYPRKNSSILIDPSLFRGDVVGIYLDTDGWDVRVLSGERKVRIRRKGPFAAANTLHEEIKNLRRDNGAVYAIVSPALQKEFAAQAEKLKFESCFAKPDGSSVIAYMFKADANSTAVVTKDLDT